MLQKTFSIYADDLDDCRLFIEAGTQHIACWFKDAQKGAVKAFEFFQFETDEKNTIESVLGEIRLYSKLMNRGINPETIIWDTGDAICVPQAFYREDLAAEYLNIIAGNTTATTVLAQQAAEDIIVSRHEVEYTSAFNTHFKNNAFTHKFSLLLKRCFINGNELFVKPQDNRLYTVFYPAHFILIAIKQQQLQIIRNFNYSTSEDALYNIMQVCNQYNMPAGGTAIVASGLIDTASNLYNTLYSYLDNFTLEEAGGVVFAAEGFSEYPAHYFLPFIYQ